MKEAKSLGEVHQSVEIPEKRNFWKTLFAFVGPAYMVSVGYMDPGNWATDIAGGSQFGYKLIWVLLLSNLIAVLLQTLAAKLGIVKGWDLAQASRQQSSNWANISLYVFAEIAIAACDLAEIIGMAIGLHLLFDLPLVWGVLITALDTFLLLFLLNKGIRKMEAFILALIVIIGVSFLVEMIIVEPNIVEVGKGFIPTELSNSALYIAIGIIGATVMPHNLYLHSALVQTRKFGKDDKGISRAIKFNFIDSTVALNLAFFVNAAILILAASAFHKNGHTEIANIEDAHILLKDIFGSLAPALFAIALIAAGQSSTITGTLAGQIVMEGYLNLRISPWMRRILTRLLAIVPALLTIFLLGENKLNDLLVLSQVILSMQLGFAVIPLIHFTSSKKIMGSFANKTLVKVLAWLAATIIVVLNIKLVYEELISFFEYLGDEYLIAKLIVLAAIFFALFLLVYIIVEPIINKYKVEKQTVPHGKAVDFTAILQHSHKHIALAVDFSKNDESTIQHALLMGGKDATYLLIHVVESAGAIKMGNEILDHETQHDLNNLNEYKNKLAAMGYRANIELGFGKSAKVIIDIINKNNIDLVVMAAHGHKGIKDFIFGSTLDKVRHGVKPDVFIVKK